MAFCIAVVKYANRIVVSLIGELQQTKCLGLLKNNLSGLSTKYPFKLWA